MTVEYNFQEFTKKDMFEIKLKGITPDFGYISIRLRRPFLDFLVKGNFMQDNGSVASRIETHTDSKTLRRRYAEFLNQYTVLESFAYHQMNNYGTAPRRIYTDQNIFTTKASKIVVMQL